MDYLKLIKITLKYYKICFIKSLSLFSKNLLILPIILIALLIGSQLIFFINSFSSITSSIISALINLIIISFYLTWIKKIIDTKRIYLKETINLDTQILSSVINIGFALSILHFIFQNFIQNAPLSFNLIHTISLILLCSSSEIIYNFKATGFNVFSYNINFIKDNSIEWILPALILPFIILTLLVGVSPAIYLIDVFIPLINFISPETIGALISLDIINIIISLFILLFSHWLMIFRGLLFLDLDSGTRRKRLFQSKF